MPPRPSPDRPPSRVARLIGTALRELAERRRAAEPAIDPTLPAAAQVIAVQHPSATLPERAYDLWLLAAVLGLLGLGTIEIYAATAADGLTQYHDAMYFLERQLMFVS